MPLTIISGASQGLGKTLADKYHLQGHDLVLLARSADKLGEIAGSHNSTPIREGQTTLPYTIDLSNIEQCKRLAKYIESKDFKIDNIICCAGSAIPKLYQDLTLEEIDDGINTNFRTTAYLLHELLPYVIDKGHIVLTSSTVAFYPLPGYGQYSPMKCAIRALADTLEMELHPRKIHVHTFFPGNFASEGYIKENLSKPEITKLIEGPSTAISVNECADILIKEINNGEHYIHTDTVGWLLACFSLGLSPRCKWYLIPLQIIIGILGTLLSRLINIYHRSLVE